MKKEEVINNLLKGQFISKVSLHNVSVLMLAIKGDFTIKDYAAHYEISPSLGSSILRKAHNSKLLSKRSSTERAKNNKTITIYTITEKGLEMAELILTKFRK